MIRVGDVIEYQPLFVLGTATGRVTRIGSDGTVFFRFLTDPPDRSEMWFKPHERDRIRVVDPAPLVDFHALQMLARNLAIGGALCASFKAGDNFGFHMGDESGGQCTCQWSPNVHGERYIGWTRCEQEIEAEESNNRYLDEDFVP